MKKQFIIAALVVVTILTTSALAIMIAKGYRVKENEIVETGSIKIESIPRSAEIYLADNRVGKTPKQLDGLDPGTYKIRLVKEDFNTWEKEVEVEAGLVTELYPQLFPSSLELSKVTSQNINRIFFSKDGNHCIFYVSEGNENGLWYKSLAKPLIQILADSTHRITSKSTLEAYGIELDNQDFDIQLSADASKFILSIKEEEQTNYFILDNSRDTNEIYEAESLLDIQPDSLQWLDNANYLLFQKDNFLCSYNLRTRQRNIITYQNPIVSGTDRERVLFREESLPSGSETLSSFELYFSNSEGLGKQVVTPKATQNELQKVKDIHTTEDKIVLESEDLLIYYDIRKNFTHKTSGENLELLSVSPDGEGFLFTKHTDDLRYLYSIIFKENAQGEIEAKEHQLLEMTESIKKISWHPLSNHFIILSSTREGEDKLIDTVTIYDKDGTNPIKLYEGQIALSKQFTVTEDATSLFLPLYDESGDTEDEAKVALYAIELKP